MTTPDPLSPAPGAFFARSVVFDRLFEDGYVITSRRNRDPVTGLYSSIRFVHKDPTLNMPTVTLDTNTDNGSFAVHIYYKNE